jgi:methylated-DNA-[protein]-cysteine S-methyltransferase
MHEFFRPSTSSLIFVRAKEIFNNHIIPRKANPMTFIMNSQRHTSVVVKPNFVDAKVELTEIQLKQRFLLSEDDNNDDSKNDNVGIDKAPSQITPFQRKVYRALCLVPEGYVTTYKSIGIYIQCASNQAIGQALKRNPYAPIIPCHRVVKSNGTIGGFHGHASGEYITRKISMLRNEGVSFLSTASNSEAVVDSKCMFSFPTNSEATLTSESKKGNDELAV